MVISFKNQLKTHGNHLVTCTVARTCKYTHMKTALEQNKEKAVTFLVC